MIDIDDQMKRMYKNPYETEGQSVAVCTMCDGQILDGDDYYWIGDRAYCQGCVADGKRFG